MELLANWKGGVLFASEGQSYYLCPLEYLALWSSSIAIFYTRVLLETLKIVELKIV